MALVSTANVAVLKPDKLHLKDQEVGGRKISLFFDGIGKYAVDFVANFSSKADSGGRRRLYKTVQEEIKDQSAIKPCGSSRENPVAISREKTIQTKTQEMKEETSIVKHKTGVSSERMESLSFNKLPSEQLKEKDFLLPNRKRVMIRSRL